MRFLLLLLFLAAASGVAAQSTEGQALVDSLERELQNAVSRRDESKQMDILLELSYNYGETNPGRGVYCGEKALRLANNLGSKQQMAQASYYLGANHVVMGNYPDALKCWMYSAEAFEALGDSVQTANSLMNIGKVHVDQKNFKQAIDYYSKALAIFQQSGDREGIAFAEGDMGSAYFVKEDYPSALIYYRRALAENTRQDSKDGIATNTGNIANTLMKMNHFADALPQFYKAAQLYRQSDDLNNYMITVGNIGECYLRIAQSNTLVEAGEWIPADRKANLQKAVSNLGHCLLLATKLGNQKARQSYSRILSEAEELSGYHEDALGHYKLYTALKDSVFSIDKTKVIEDLTTLRENQLKKKDIEIQDKKIAYARLKKSNERIYFFAGFLLLTGAILVTFYQYRVKTRNRLLRASIQGEEAERLRIASELHDDVGATLSSIRLFLTQAELKPDINLISQSKMVLDDSIQKIRDLSHQLQPRTLQYLGLARALESLAELISRSGSVKMEFAQKDDQWPEPDAQTALSVYRIVQELINNIVKHANAGWIRLALQLYQGKYGIHIAHNGLGLTAAGYQEQLYKKSAIGLKNIENRLKSSKLTLLFPEPKNDIYFIELYLPDKKHSYA